MLGFSDEDVFSAWVAQYPSMAMRVLADMALVEQMMTASSDGVRLLYPPTVVAEVRDALARLHAVSSEAGFEDVAAFFYECYERCCRALLPFGPDGTALVL